jgi:hypothetical protein
MVVVDNVGAHKPDRIRELLEAAGCELVFVPADSPHLCPIEEAFSKLKALIRAAAARTRAALDAAIATALQAVTPAGALALAIVSRVMSTAVELVCAGVAAIAARLSARRPART